jgi:hypothetical protein
MLLELTIRQLDIGPVPKTRAIELGQLGYMQWLGSLPGHVGYAQEARRALSLARPFIGCSPAVAVFCDLLAASLRISPAPLALALPARRRRGGARSRRPQG